MRVRDFGLGLFVGLAAGWIAGWWTQAGVRPSGLVVREVPAPAPSLVRQASRRDAGSGGESAPEPGAAAATSPEGEDSVVIVPMDASAAEINRIVSGAGAKGQTLGPLDYAALDLRIAEARRNGDAALMRVLLALLFTTRTPEARERLLTLLEDETFVFPDRSMSGFRAAFDGAGTPRLVAAARRRFDAERAARNCDAAMKSGWQRLVADHGTESDLEWLVGFRGEWNAAGAIVEALADSNNPLAHRRAEQEFRQGNELRHGFSAYCRKRGEEAFPVAWEIASGFFRGDPVSRELEEGDFLGSFAATVPKDRAAEVSAAITSCPDARRRVRGVTVASVLIAREFDRAALDPIVAFPIDTLARLPSSPPDRSDGGIATTATYAIEYNRDLLWTPQAAETLEACARRFGTEYPHEHMEQVAKIIRQHLADPWRRK